MVIIVTTNLIYIFFNNKLRKQIGQCGPREMDVLEMSSIHCVDKGGHL